VKVLILHQHFKTPAEGGAIRSYYLAKALVDKGIQVEVISAGNQKKYLVDDLEGIRIHYLPISYDNAYGFYARGFSFLKYTAEAVRIAGKIKDVNICYAISVPLNVGQAALLIKRFYKIPFIFEVGDLWPDAPIELGFIKNPILKLFLYGLEKRIYNQSNKVVALSTAIKAAIQKKAPQKQVEVIENMSDTTFYVPEEKKQNLMDRFSIAKDEFVVSYIGAVGFANGLDYYLECARASQKEGLRVRFILCGAGAFTEQLKRVAKSLQLTNITFIPFQNRPGVKEVMNVTDASFISYKPFPILETGSPNKYFDGLAAGKLIITNFKGWIKNEIEHEQCGIALDSRYPHDFVKKIQPLLDNKSLLEQYKKNARRLAEAKYSRTILGEKFARLFN
jgi:glycosyltransferase involved in cell wall biosynthesis